jgi:hypothetical protein
MNTCDGNQAAWLRAPTEATEDGRFAAGKPVFFYLWPQYHDGTPRTRVPSPGTAAWLCQGRMVRICLPPAASHANFLPHLAEP